jgi:pyridoxal phosphate enzyme (YggS family)
MISNLPSVRKRLAENYKRLRERIEAACAAVRRDSSEITLVAVTKAVEIDVVRQAIEIGLADLGESRAQQLNQRAGMIHEFIERRVVLGGRGERDLPRPRWHMVGHLQRNKVKLVVPWTEMIHSVDSLRLAEEIHEAAIGVGRVENVLMQVNVSGERSKFGVAIGAAPHLAEQFNTWSGLRLCGLMTMLPSDATPDEQRLYFDRLRETFEDMRDEKIVGREFRHLSMGMSRDFEAAIACGATIIRIGESLFDGLTTRAAEPPEETE